MVNNYEEIFDFCEIIINQETKINKNNFLDIDKLLVSFLIIFKNENKKLPYHINILDLLWANENAHSRIFTELLKQKNENEYEILTSFFRYIQNKFDDGFNYSPKKPKITSEKDRIDLLILDDDYSIIVENKIHDATDQDKQVERYIDKVKKKNYLDNHIFIIYITKDNQKKISDESFGIYKDSFKSRYIHLTFRDDILYWLKNEILPNCRIKEVFLKSTIEQYIDYIEGMFNLRETNKNMNKELQEFLKKQLNFTSNVEDNYKKLIDKQEQIQQLTNQLENIKKDTERECWNEWYNRLKVDFPNLEVVNNINARYNHLGVILKINNIKFSVLIEKDEKIYFGFSKVLENEILNNDLKEILRPYIVGFKFRNNWYGCKYTSFTNGYKKLKGLIEEIIKHPEITY